MKTLLKVNFQAALYSLQVYQTGTFPVHFFSRIFQSDSFFEQMFREVSERLHNKASSSKTWKTSKDQTFAYSLQKERSEKN